MRRRLLAAFHTARGRGILPVRLVVELGDGMADPLTLAAVGALALAEGIKFLYGQAGEVLKRWRERKATAATGPTPVASEPVAVELPAAAFDGRLRDPRLDFRVVARLGEGRRGP